MWRIATFRIRSMANVPERKKKPRTLMSGSTNQFDCERGERGPPHISGHPHHQSSTTSKNILTIPQQVAPGAAVCNMIEYVATGLSATRRCLPLCLCPDTPSSTQYEKHTCPGVHIR